MEEQKKKIGRPLKIPTPEVMLEWFHRYKKWAKENPIRKNDFRGGAAKEVILELERPLSLEGFEVFVAEQSNYEILGLDQYFYCDYEKEKHEFMSICSIIRREIRADQVGGGMAGIYNASLTARLNNLVDKQEVQGKQEHTIINLGDGEEPNKK